MSLTLYSIITSWLSLKALLKQMCQLYPGGGQLSVIDKYPLYLIWDSLLSYPEWPLSLSPVQPLPSAIYSPRLRAQECDAAFPNICKECVIISRCLLQSKRLSYLDAMQTDAFPRFRQLSSQEKRYRENCGVIVAAWSSLEIDLIG